MPLSSDAPLFRSDLRVLRGKPHLDQPARAPRGADPAAWEISRAVESIERSILEIRRELGFADGAGDVIIEVADAEESGQWSRAAHLRSTMTSAYRRADGGSRVGPV